MSEADEGENDALVGSLRAAIIHIFLPLQLPGEAEEVPFERYLLTLVISALEKFAQVTSSNKVVKARDAIVHLHGVLTEAGYLDGRALTSAFSELAEKESAIPLFVKSQNAGLIVSNSGAGSVRFEPFQVTPDNASVVLTKGRLRRTFPESSVSVPLTTFQGNDFQIAMAEALAKMSSEKVQLMSPPNSSETRRVIYSLRDPMRPGMITALLQNFLLAHGDNSGARAFTKNTREVVALNDTHNKPWRRSSVWAVTRVALQSILRESEAESSDRLYKSFMIFFMSQVLHQGVQHELPTWILASMKDKIVQRRLKLAPEGSEAWLEAATEIVSLATSELQKRWRIIIMGGQTPPITYPTSIPQNCLKFANRAILDFVNSAGTGESQEAASESRNDHCFARESQDEIPSVCSDETTDLEKTYNLLTIEAWADQHVDEWLLTRSLDNGTCAQLHELSRSYHSRALKVYKGSPEGLSAMYLTVLCLWMACDTAALKRFPLLAEFSPSIPIKFCQMLHLTKSRDLQRLHQAEVLVRSRQGQSIFSKFGHASSFAARYVDSSEYHENLRIRIEQTQRRERQQKLYELRKAKLSRKDMISRAKAMTCECKWDEGRRISHICKKCQLQHEARNLRITTYQLRLPSCEAAAKEVVFEADPPPEFCAWRALTLSLITEVFPYRHSTGYRLAEVTIANAQKLSGFRAKDLERSVISLRAPTFHHQGSILVGIADAKSVIVENDYQWSLFDNRAKLYIDTFLRRKGTDDQLIYNLPPEFASQQVFLQRYSDSKEGPSFQEIWNRVIADQSKCPKTMALDEYKELFSIGLSYRIQWQNILRQLAMPVIDWRRPVTLITIWQVTSQAGPRSCDSHRCGRDVLKEPYFAAQMLRYLKMRLDCVKENWDSTFALAAFSSLAMHLLYMAPSDASTGFLDFLRQCWTVALQWLRVLQQQEGSTISAGDRSEMNERRHEIALVAANCFPELLSIRSDLFQDPAILADFLECSMIAQQTELTISWSTRGDIAERRTIVDTLMLRWRRMLHSLPALLTEPPSTASQVCDTLAEALSTAIVRLWPSFDVPTATFWQVAGTGPATAQAVVLRPRSNGKGDVHVNLLTAKLLIDGFPLGRLPPEYENAPLFRTLFKHQSLNCGPSDEPGMQFQADAMCHNYEVHLGLYKGKSTHDLVVRAKRDGKTYNLLPRNAMMKVLLPHTLLQDYVHWHETTTKFILFCPKGSPWPENASPYTLQPTGRDKVQNWSLHRRRQTINGQEECLMINTGTKIGGGLAQIFSGLVQSRALLLWYSETARSIDIDIPSLRLSFFIKDIADETERTIKSVQYPSMHGASYTLETLVGLQHKLLLQGEDGDRKMVLVPEGIVSYASGDHVQVSCRDQATRVQVYDLRALLGNLEGNGSVQSKLFLAYLHAVTSSPMPDPFTSHTGTEQALTILRSEGVCSFHTLSNGNRNLLDNLARLSPRRTYLGSSSNIAEKVSWDPVLCPYSQHSGLAEEVEKIRRQEAEYSYLNNRDQYYNTAGRPDTDLYIRDKVRSSTFRTSTYGSNDYTHRYDLVWRGDANVASGQRVRETCRALLSGTALLLQGTGFRHLNDHRHELERFFDAKKVMGKETLGDIGQLQYGQEWLHSHSKIMPDRWCNLHLMLQAALAKANPVRLRLWLCSLSFHEDCQPAVVEALVGIVCSHSVRSLSIPSASVFDLSAGYKVEAWSLRSLCDLQRASDQTSPVEQVPRETDETEHAWIWRRKTHFQRNAIRARDQYIAELEGQWDCQVSDLEQPGGMGPYYNQIALWSDTTKKWQSWLDNRDFREYLARISTALALLAPPLAQGPKLSALSVTDTCHRSSRAVDLGEILERILPPSLGELGELPDLTKFLGKLADQNYTLLEAFLKGVKTDSQSDNERQYVKSLKESARSLQRHGAQQCLVGNASDLSSAINTYADSASHAVAMMHPRLEDLFENALQNEDLSGNDHSRLKGMHFALAAQQGPRWSRRVLLALLNHNSVNDLPEAWLEFMITYAESIERHQYSRRLVVCLSREGRSAALLKELSNTGCGLWDRTVHLDTLLLEIEMNIRVRANQGEIASQMRDPVSNSNTVMQLNMGEGKSSVIVPIVAASLAGAGGDSLVRVIAARPQSQQMFDTLVSAMGGIIGRRIYRLPFTRDCQLTLERAQTLRKLLEKCLDSGGVLLVQPEHILSLQLVTIEKVIEEKTEDVATELLKIQDLLQETARDLVDESDENFSPKFELIYTMGKQQPIDFAPHSWTITQKILDELIPVAQEVAKNLPDSIDVGYHEPGTFPLIRILDRKGQMRFIKSLSGVICHGDTASPLFARLPASKRETIRDFLTNRSLSKHEIEAAEESDTQWDISTRKTILLLRGLFAHGILEFALTSKRWRVNYGPDRARKPPTRLSVPYRAKDIPSAKSEFSHPDVVIILTCLAYYYSGMSDEELFETLGFLRASDQAVEEYEKWMKTTTQVPTHFRHLKDINLRDRKQCKDDLFPHLRQLKATVDYFLGHIVFPKEMREFPEKISASGWDLAALKAQPLTGFSGTNDSQHCLPLSVTQLDLDSQRHTNALVLEYLFREDNSVMGIPKSLNPAEGFGMAFLRQVAARVQESGAHEIQVILDVGAYIIDLTNEQVAAAWLRISDSRVHAVVFCNAEDELCVLDRHGRAESLMVSPYKGKLDVCLVYLDEAHTRGIDLRLPKHYRAAVTLGANVTKDRLAQACMRMRELGKGQAVLFCVPSDIDVKIRAIPSFAPKKRKIKVEDVLRWAMRETMADLQRLLPIWAAHGTSFQRHDDLWREIETNGDALRNRATAKLFLTNDAPNIDTRYRAVPVEEVDDGENEDIEMNETARLIAERCKQFNISSDGNTADMEEEQERELQPEKEREKQVQRPEPDAPHTHKIHADVQHFACTGQLSHENGAFIQAFKSLDRTSAADHLDVLEFPRDLWVTQDFALTVRGNGSDRHLDAFQRDVRWVVTAAENGTVKHMVIISPFEADQLLCDIKKNASVKLHVYAPRQSQEWKAIDDLQLYVVPSPAVNEEPAKIPARFITALNLFAGQLYFSSYEEYIRTCEYLNLSWQRTSQGMTVQRDGFIRPEHREGQTEGGFKVSPVFFLQTLMQRVRRGCRGIEKSHVGRVLEGGLLSEVAFEESIFMEES